MDTSTLPPSQRRPRGRAVLLWYCCTVVCLMWPTLREVEEHASKASNVLTVSSRVKRANIASERPPRHAPPDSQAHADAASSPMTRASGCGSTTWSMTPSHTCSRAEHVPQKELTVRRKSLRCAHVCIMSACSSLPLLFL